MLAPSGPDAGTFCPTVNTPSGPPGPGVLTALRTVTTVPSADTVLGMLPSGAALVEAGGGPGNVQLGRLTLSPTPHVTFFGTVTSRFVTMTQGSDSGGSAYVVGLSGPHRLVAWTANGRRAWQASLALAPDESLATLFPAGPNVVALVTIHQTEEGLAIGIDGANGKVLFRTPVLARFWGGENGVLCAGSTVYLESDFVLLGGHVTQSGGLRQTQGDTVFAVSARTGKIRWQTGVGYTLRPTGPSPTDCVVALSPVVANATGIVVQSGREPCNGALDLPWTTRLLSAGTGRVLWSVNADSWPAVSDGANLAELARVSPAQPQYRMDIVSVATGRVVMSLPLSARAVPRFATQTAFLVTVPESPPPTCPPAKTQAGMPCPGVTTTEFAWTGHAIRTFPTSIVPPLSEAPTSGDWYAQQETAGTDALLAYTIQR